MQIVYSYFRYTGRHFLGCAFSMLAVILPGLLEKPGRNKDWVKGKST